jgi:diguanylate cyclase (GGDEF)-like protein
MADRTDRRPRGIPDRVVSSFPPDPSPPIGASYTARGIRIAEGCAKRVEIVVLGLLGLSLVMIAVAVAGHRAASRAHADLDRTTKFDVLTGLPGRLELEAALTQSLAAAAGERRGALVLIELNRFAAVNDTYGHEIGDGLLVAAAEQLRGALADGESLYRPSGPQFAVLNPELTDSIAAERRSEELQSVVRVPFRIGTDHLRVSTTAGVAMIDRRVAAAPNLLHDASIALQHTHDQGAPSSVVYALSMQAAATGHSAERRLREALENDEFWLLYLPVVALGDFELVGVEALLRWADPERGLVSPSEFLSMLDDSGLIVPVGEWVIEQACRQNVAWQRAFPERELVTTINVSPKQLARPDFMDRMLETVHDAGADPNRICLEITQGMVMREIESSWGMLRTARDAGIKLALDDFGTGFSSLAYLRQLSLDVLKIDRAFVTDVATNREDAAIAQQLIALAHALELAPVAEGVDSADQAQTLHGLGCDFAQGYFFSPPQPVTAIDKLLTRRTVTPVGQGPSIDWTGGGAAPAGSSGPG